MSVGLQEDTIINALRTVAVNASYTASRALSKWLKKGVHLESEGFVSTPIGEVVTTIGGDDDAIAAIHMPLTGDMTGHMMLTFPERMAKSIVDHMMMASPGTTTELDEVAQSCLQETGNIVASAYANSLAKWLNVTVEPGVPEFGHDMAASLLEPLLNESALEGDEVFVAMTDFQLDGQRLEWGLMLIPSNKSLALMRKRCRMESVRENALQTIAVNGAFNASRAMSKWVRRGVKIATEGFSRCALADVPRRFDADKPIVGLHLPLSDVVAGHALLAMTRESACHLCDVLLGHPYGTTVELDELECSSLAETGNILSSSFMNGWSTWMRVDITPGPPQFVMDLPEAVFDGILCSQALCSDTVFLAETRFLAGDRTLEWDFVFVPSPSAMRIIETSCD